MNLLSVFKFFIAFSLNAIISIANASDFLVMKRDVTSDGNPDTIKLIDKGGQFYTLSVISNDREILHNEELVPNSIKNKGGLEVFQGLSVADNNISLRYRFCSPSSSVCYDRSIIAFFKDEQFLLLNEEVVASADNISLSNTFYQKEKVPFSSVTYQSLVENNDKAEAAYSSVFGACVAGLGGDALAKISEELEKNSPGDWVMRKGCVTPALVFNLETQKYLSHKAAMRYLLVAEQHRPE